MQLEVGKILEGKITGITNFGAFVDLGEGQTGMVHISEVSSTYVKEISEHLKVEQLVKVKVLKIDDNGKVSLSIKKAEEPKRNDFQKRPQNKSFQKSTPSNANEWTPKKQEPLSFEDMLNKFKQSSDEKLLDIRKNVDGKRGSYSRKQSR